MIRPRYRLTLALLASALLHLAPWVAEWLSKPAPPPARQVIQARLQAPLPLPPQTPLRLEETAPEEKPVKPANKVIAAAKPAKSPFPANTWQQEVQRQFQKRQQQGLFYPAEAIVQGLQGDVLVFLIVDRHGQISAARIEQSSGFRILDDAALGAVRALRSLPADTPQEILLPVSFRLK